MCSFNLTVGPVLKITSVNFCHVRPQLSARVSFKTGLTVLYMNGETFMCGFKEHSCMDERAGNVVTK